MTTGIVERDLSFQIMRAAYEVHICLGTGFLENIYENAMIFELESMGHQVETQKRVRITYKGKQIGEHFLDQVIDGRVILELKAVSEIAPIHKQQALSYLKATGLPLAIVINFGSSRVQSARVVNTEKQQK